MDSNDRYDATIGAIVRFAVGYLAVFMLGWFGHAWFYGNEPAPYIPPPQPSPYYPRPDNDVWYTPSRSVLRELPPVIADGYDRRGQTWRWEHNQRFEYRYHRVTGEAPVGDAPKNIGQAKSAAKADASK
jgi:hypothetical protein